MTISRVCDLKQLTLEEFETEKNNMDCVPTSSLFMRYGGITAYDQQPMEGGASIDEARLDEMRVHIRRSLGNEAKLVSSAGLKGGEPLSLLNFCASVIDGDPTQIYEFSEKCSTQAWPVSRHEVEQRNPVELKDEEIADITTNAIAFLNEQLSYDSRGVPVLILNGSGTYHCVVYAGPYGDGIMYFDPDPQFPGIWTLSREDFALAFWNASSFNSIFPNAYGSRVRTSLDPAIIAGTELGELDIGGWWEVRIHALDRPTYYKSASDADEYVMTSREQHSAVIIENPQGIFQVVPVNDVNNTPDASTSVDTDGSKSGDYFKDHWGGIHSLKIHLGYVDEGGTRAYLEKIVPITGKLSMRDMP